MARLVYINSKIYPDDYKKPLGSLAIKLPMNSTKFSPSDSMFNLSYTTEEQAISNMINLLLTKDGERYMQPELGVGLYYQIFEQNTPGTNTELEFRIRRQMAEYLPYIVLDDITIQGNFNEDENGINIIIRFRVTEGGANRTVTVFTDAESQINVEVN